MAPYSQGVLVDRRELLANRNQAIDSTAESILPPSYNLSFIFRNTPIGLVPFRQLQ